MCDSNHHHPGYRTANLMVASLALSFVMGCSRHHVRYKAFIRNEIEETERATTIHGRFDEAKALFDKARLPHNTVRRQYELQLQAIEKLTDQLGSEDYVLIGEVNGWGSAKATPESLRAKFCEEAAEEGGDAVMIINEGLQERPYVFTTPGYATTYAYGSLYGCGYYGQGYTTGYTTYTPGQTYSGVYQLPYGRGLVFKFVPGAGRRRRSITSLEEMELVRVLRELEALNDESIPFDEALDRSDALVAEAIKR